MDMTFAADRTRILVVDDSRVSAAKLRLAVRALGHDVETAADGAAALDMLKSRAFDVVLLDIVMEGMDGYAVLEAMSADPALRDTPVIVVSGLDDTPENVARALRLGAVDFLPKNFEPTILRARLDASIARRRRRARDAAYRRGVETMTRAARIIDDGPFRPDDITVDDVAARSDALGRFARVFRGLAATIYERERRLDRAVRTLRGGLLLLAAGATFGLIPAVSRIAAAEGAAPLGLAVWVSLASAALCFAVAGARGRLPRLRPEHMKFFLLWALVLGVLHRLATFVIAGHVEASMIALIGSTRGFVVFGLAALLALDRATLRRLCGLGVGFAAVALVLVSSGVGAASSLPWLGAALSLPLLHAIHNLLLVWRPKELDGFACVGVMSLLSAAFLAPMAIAAGALSPPTGADWRAWLALIVILGAASAVSLALVLDLVRTAGPVFASLTSYAQTLAGVVWAMVLLDERLSPIAWAAMALMFAGFWLVEPQRMNGAFALRLPLDARKRPPMLDADTRPPDTAPAEAALSARVLVVDDSRLSAAKLALAMRALGHEVETADSGAAALRRLRERPFDVVLLDIVMPGMDGFDVLRALKADPALAHLPVIVVSSLEDGLSGAVHAIALGAIDFLSKDFEPEILKARLDASLARKRARDREIEDMRRVAALVEAAGKIESGRFSPETLGLDAIAASDDPLGRLSAVFRGMAAEIYRREMRMLRAVTLLQGALLVIAVGVVWGATPALARGAAGLGADPLGLAVWVNAIGAVVCLGVAVARGRAPRLTMAEFGFFLQWALVAGVAQRLAILLLSTHVEAVMLSLVVTLEGLMTLAAAAVMRLARPTPRRMLGMTVSILGVAALILGDARASGDGVNLWLLAAPVVPMLFVAQGLLIAGRRPQRIDLFASCGLMMLISTLLLAPIAYGAGGLFMLGPSIGRLEIFTVMLGLAVTGSLLLAFQLTARTGAVFASIKASTCAIGGVFWGIALLGEQVSPLGWVAAGAVLAGLWLVGPRAERKEIALDLPLPARPARR